MTDHVFGDELEPQDHEGHTRVVVHLPDRDTALRALGQADASLRLLEQNYPTVRITVRDMDVALDGPVQDTRSAAALLEELVVLAQRGTDITERTVMRVTRMLREAEGMRPASALATSILSTRGKTIRPKTVNQKHYVDAIDEHTVVFGVGPAGTGKTYLAMAKAVRALQAKEVNRIILTRPAVEAGERLGFLPGSLNDKIDPYLRPLYDALHDMMDPESIPRLMEAGTIEVAPLAYMRGRTLNDAFVILDEAQNTTPEQMKMFLTRLGFGSRIVVTGDVTQVDLPGSTSSGLRQVQHVLQNIDDIAFCELTAQDVVRHELVGEIVSAYEQFDTTNRHRNERRRRKDERRAAASTTAEPGQEPS
ncbi:MULTISPECIES: PhoH family protein [unclassified Candidatus Sulfotelmatobacter]|uniref:PhoH family protein n=1 Tax=unclassified Candidatus Sulfotelmatobacter TaxID=2635724 RepID=UPI001CC261FF|nr:MULTISPECIES: PhoH family protein [unclassified Candidatus Sulfotelmatobacter]